MRSFTLDLEISVMVRGEEFLTELRAVEDAYRAVSRELTLEEWQTRPLSARSLRQHRAADGRAAVRARSRPARRGALLDPALPGSRDLDHLVARHDLDARATLRLAERELVLRRARASRRGSVYSMPRSSSSAMTDSSAGSAAPTSWPGP